MNKLYYIVCINLAIFLKGVLNINFLNPKLINVVERAEHNNMILNINRPLKLPDVTDNNCECVPYYLCLNNSIITDGEGLIDIRMQNGPCESYLDLCCSSENTIIKKPVMLPIKKSTGCGVRHPDGLDFRITGNHDNESQYGEFPWMIAILYDDNTTLPPKFNVYQCGGSLIHPQVVLTSAHCVDNKQRQHLLKVRAGEWDTQTKNEPYLHQDVSVSKVILHEEYYSPALLNDIALLILKFPLTLAENIDIVCLPTQNMNVIHTPCTASGWGKNSFGKEGKYQVILKKIDLPFVERKECIKSLRKTRLGRKFQLHRSFICAGGEFGKDTCKGDGGSPLICPISNSSLEDRYVQVGIVGWGIGCGENGTPGVYVNVAIFRDWIDQQLKHLGFNIDNQL